MHLTTTMIRAIILCLSFQFCVSSKYDIYNSDSCYCSRFTMFCKQGEIPVHIPNEIRELIIEQFDFRNFSRSQFKNVPNILKLDIYSEQGDTEHGDSIPPRSFDKFTNLTYLGIHGKEIRSISRDAFLGLANVLTLNLSSNRLLHFSEIRRALSSDNREVLPNLVSLSVAKVKTSLIDPVDLGVNFFKSISSGRKLKYLDISDLNIFRVDYRAFEPVCNSLETAVLRNSIVGSAINYVGVEPCKSLRTLDISGIVLPVLRTKFSFKTFTTFDSFCESFGFYTNVTTFMANNINEQNTVDINAFSLDMSLCPFQVQSIVFEGNRFKWLNMTVLLHEVTKKSIYELKFSNNGLEYISPSVLQPSENIHNLDFSNNKLNVMQEIYTDDFERLFWAQTKLRYLNLSHNNLNSIPIQTFSRNILLKILDISYNNIKTLHFSLNQFVGIEKLIASHNKIHIIEHAFRMDMQRILLKSFKDSTGDDGTFFVYLEGNEFQCKCDKVNMKFIDWLHSTEIVHENETLTCNLEGSVVDIRGTGLAETSHMCKMQTIKKTAMIVTPIVTSAVILGLITVVFVWRRRKRKLLIRKVIAQIQMGIFPLPHLAFLSYCNEDTDLVMNKIYPELCEHLADMTHSDESLVCLGDKDFRPGFPLRDEVMRSVEESSVFVAIVSKNFCRRAWCNLEIQEAYDQRKPIVLLLVEHVEKELMDDFLKKVFDRYAHATWKPDDNGGHIEPEWKIFCRSIIQLAGKSITTEKTVGLPAEIVFVV